MRRFAGDCLGEVGSTSWVSGAQCLGGCGCSHFRDARQDTRPAPERKDRDRAAEVHGLHLLSTAGSCGTLASTEPTLILYTPVAGAAPHSVTLLWAWYFRQLASSRPGV